MMKDRISYSPTARHEPRGLPRRLHALVRCSGRGLHPFALFCLQRGKKALLPQELYRILNGLDRHLRENDEAWLSDAWPLTFYRLVDILLQSNRIAEVHRITTTVFQLDLSLQPSFQRGFKGSSLVKSFRK